MRSLSRFKYIIGHDIGKLDIRAQICDKLVLKQLHLRNGHAKEIPWLLLRQLTEATL